VAAAFKMVAYGVAADATDDYVRMGESIALKYLSQDTRSTARRPKSRRKAKECHLEEGEATKPTSGMKSGKTKEREKKRSKSNPPNHLNASSPP
jgi:hypothetical protein